MTLVIATGGIDLSVGSLMAIAGALAPMIFLGKLVPDRRIRRSASRSPSSCRCWSPGCFGWFNGWLITRFRIQPIVATLVLFIAGRGIAQVLTNGNLQVFNSPEFQFIGLGRVVRRSVPGHPDAGRSSRPPPGSLRQHRCSAARSWPSAATRRAARLSGMPVAPRQALRLCHQRPAAPASPA